MTHKRNSVKIPIFCILLASFMMLPGAGAKNPGDVVDETRKRVDVIFRADSGKPLVRDEKKPPLAPGRGNYVRAYSYSMVAFAARCLYLNEKLDEANAALVENAKHYIDNPKDVIDRDSFHWHADIVLRLIEMYGTKGSTHPGRLAAGTEEACLKATWIYVKASSSLEKADREKSKTWHLYSTENHHAMDFTVNWHFAKIAKDRPEYRDLRCDDGATLEQHYRAWNDYIIAYCVERAKKGINIEIMCPGYNNVWLKGLYNFRDFGEPKVRRAVDMLMDLYWAHWAQEQLHGVEGGGKTRIRGVNGFSHKIHGVPVLGWLYFGIGGKPDSFSGETNAMLSEYRPPALVAEIARTSRENGPYEIRQRAQGLGVQTSAESPLMTKDMVPNKFRSDGGGIVRYSYCDPAFTIGCLMTEARPLSDWVHISAQGRWQGVIFSDNARARIVPVVRPAAKARDVLNGQWSVQSMGCLITQKLKTNKGGGAMIVWMPKEGMGVPVVEDDLVFVETGDACAVIRVAGSGFKLSEEAVSNPTLEGPTRHAPPGHVIVPDNEYAPVIVEVMAKRTCKDLTNFKRMAKACKLEMKNGVLSYASMYGNILTLDTRYKQPPTIHGKPVDYAPAKVFDSPFLRADYNSGVVTISKGERTKILDFNTLR